MGRPLRLLFQGSPESTRIALLDETRLLEFYQEDTGAQSLVGSVFLGRVERVLPENEFNEEFFSKLKEDISAFFAEKCKVPAETLIEARYERFRKF